MSKSTIEWTDETWNPVGGCKAVSPGCANCYAARMAKRLAAMGQERYKGLVDEHGRWTGEYRAGGTNLPSDDSMFDWLRDRGRWRPSIHMPRWASRITLNATSVRVERVQDISNLGAFAEGTPDLRTHDNDWDLRDCYSHLWDSINAKRGFGWDSNPWVWVVGFERVTA